MSDQAKKGFFWTIGLLCALFLVFFIIQCIRAGVADVSFGVVWRDFSAFYPKKPTPNNGVGEVVTTIVTATKTLLNVA